jgi:hypothetical protein
MTHSANIGKKWQLEPFCKCDKMRQLTSTPELSFYKKLQKKRNNIFLSKWEKMGKIGIETEGLIICNRIRYCPKMSKNWGKFRKSE